MLPSTYSSICFLHSSPLRNAAMVAIGENSGAAFISLASIHSWKRWRSESFGTTEYELTIPAMLKVFDGAPKVMLHAAASGETLANGMCLLPNRAMSQWISSEMTIMPLLWQKDARRSRVSRGHTIPAGLCGLESMSILHLSSHTASRFSKSIS